MAEDSFSKPLTVRLFTFRSPQSNADIPSLCVPWSCCDHFTVRGEYLVASYTYELHIMSNLLENLSLIPIMIRIHTNLYLKWNHGVFWLKFLLCVFSKTTSGLQPMTDHEAMQYRCQNFGDPVRMGTPGLHIHMRMGTPL